MQKHLIVDMLWPCSTFSKILNALQSEMLFNMNHSLKLTSFQITLVFGIAYSSHLSHLFLQLLVYWLTCPCKNQAWLPFWCPYRNVDFSAYNSAQDNQLQKATSQN